MCLGDVSASPRLLSASQVLAIGLKGKCRRLLKFPEEPARWEPPGVPDDRAGAWPAVVVRTFPHRRNEAVD